MRRTTYFRQFIAPSGGELSYQALGGAEGPVKIPAGARFQADARTVLEVTALAPDLFRVGLFGEGRRPDYRSEAVVEQDWPIPDVSIERDASSVRISTPAASAHVELRPLRVGFEDRQGRAFAVDDTALGMGFLPLAPPEQRLVDPLGAPIRLYKRHHPGTHYFGCGERTGGLEKTGSHQVFWNIDPPSGHTAALNNLYTSIPFVLALEGGWAWGLFFDSAYRVEFDLANEAADRCWFGADGGDLVYYVFAGPTPRAVLERYTQLTGRVPMPPRWALGNHQSRWGYKTADQVRQVARGFRERDIPCDVLYLDIDHMDGYRVFTWDRERFPDPAGLIAELAAEGFKVVTIVDPGVKVDEAYPVYVMGREEDLFCKTFLGEEYRNVVWPGVCAFPDFTDPRAREWWGENHRALVDDGVRGIWCDMNEPTVFIPTPQTMPPDVAHHGERAAKLHAQVHNLYGSLMARATREGLLRLRPERRPFVISRSGFAGLQRHALHWTGDNSSWWEHLWMSMPQLQNLGLSGYAWVGVDVGGYAGDCTGELLARWNELGAFQPFNRNHAAWNTRPQEPWAFGEPYESAIRAMLKLRQRLIPYLYSLFEECHRTGAPVLRPLLFEYPDDETTYSMDDEFLVGPSLLVAPIARPGVEHRHVYLPVGTWFHYWTGERSDGPAHILAHAPLGRPAVYVRANTPLPLWPAMGYDGERRPDPLTLLIFPAAGGEGEFSLYEDASDGFEHERGQFARTRISCHASDDLIRVEIGEREGSFEPERTVIELELRGVPSPPEAVSLDGAPIDAWRYEADQLVVSLRASRERQVAEVQIPRLSSFSLC
jgi:alpha-glucosidase